MNITAKELNTIQACRYCPMCRQSCPSEFINYKESDTPRGRAMLLYSVYKGGKPFEASTVEAMYNCFLCGACKSWCEGQELGGYDIPELVKFARRDIVDQGLAPQIVQDIRNSLLVHDNTQALDKSHAFTATVEEKRADVLYLLGEGVDYRYPEIARAFVQILQTAGVDHTLLKSEPNSGKELDLLGYRDDAKEKASALINRIQATGCRTVVVSDPLVYDAFKNDYEQWGITLEAEVLHVSEYLLRLIQGGKLRLKPVDFTVTLADSEFLGRFNGLYEIPRAVIQSFNPVQFVEMQWHHGYMQSTGEAAFTFDDKAFGRGKDLGEKISTKAEEAGAEIIVVLSVTAKQHISATTSLKVVDIVEFVNEHIDIF
ncbi:(Fe-S)-binding protein [Sphingobacterium chuzhouense]|uniref:(Fe-S)-binding protein n=1 Tax=Sphingobacterium chuzhouense TaxID=1742264 RepID=A0ABR7XT34_9SPHI|nr:(Fe-S)-binding protein [Sphingobacterium chuzhouense]MBD1422326.1 (Fe-S)-binding protein [Sphingobacterium chuzhouense]